MPKEFSRTERIGDLIKKELSIILRTEIGDRRLMFILITKVKVSSDLSLATIFFTQIPSKNSEDNRVAPDSTALLLKKAAARLRYILSKRLTLRTVPHLRFFYDLFPEESHRLHNLIDQIIQKDKEKRLD